MVYGCCHTHYWFCHVHYGSFYRYYGCFQTVYGLFYILYSSYHVAYCSFAEPYCSFPKPYCSFAEPYWCYHKHYCLHFYAHRHCCSSCLKTCSDNKASSSPQYFFQRHCVQPQDIAAVVIKIDGFIQDYWSVSNIFKYCSGFQRKDV